MIPSDQHIQIQYELDSIEREESVTILWACESGSRAWGFASADSDYDVRFIYLRKTEDYLRASPLRDVIEKPLSGDLDFSGWDLPKALGLFRKSNPPLLEWLQSPIVYRRQEAFVHGLTSLIPEFYSPVACFHHYLSMADRNRRSYLDKPVIRLKRYFYMLRPLLACMWIRRGLGLPPTEFDQLLDVILPTGEVRMATENLKQRKQTGEELDTDAPIPVLSDFIQSQMDLLSSIPSGEPFTRSWEPLDALFRHTLFHVNGSLVIG